MLSPEQQSMFQMFQSDFNTEAASTDNTIAGQPPEGAIIMADYMDK
ncbi:MAG: hypothetical protein ACLUOI_25635 [Eisenbergiella sp.]